MLEGVGWGREREGELVDLSQPAEPACSLALGLIFNLEFWVAS